MAPCASPTVSSRSTRPAPKCHGSGQIISDPCPNCQGVGKIRTTKVVEVKIPAGINDGQRIRMSGRGEPGMNGGESGDLYIEISVKPHDIFSRDGDDLHTELPVSFVTAALGGELTVPTLEGESRITLPEGTQSGKTFRLRGKGVKNLRTGEPAISSCTSPWRRPSTSPPSRRTCSASSTPPSRKAATKHNPKTQGFFDRMKSFFK